MSVIVNVVKRLVENLHKSAYNPDKGIFLNLMNTTKYFFQILGKYQTIYRYEVPFLCGALRSIGR